MKRKYKIAMISSCDIGSRGVLSGTSFYIRQALEEYLGSVDIIDKFKPNKRSWVSLLTNIDFCILFLMGMARHLFWNLFSKNYRWERTILVSKYYARKIREKIRGKKYDFILTDKGSIEIAYLETDIPIIYMSDATFKLMIDFYPEFSNLTLSAILQGNNLEKKTIDKAALCIYHSEWAAYSAIHDYGKDKDKATVIYNGPNIDAHLLPLEEHVTNKPIPDICNLLLVGVDWHRKNVDLAMGVVNRLNTMGIRAGLTICGCTPPRNQSINGNIKIIPYLDKNTKDGMEKLAALYRNATYFIFPTRAECLGIVLIEACAFGLPILSSDVGGVPEIVRNGTNGFTFALTATAEEYSRKIAENFRNVKEYKKMCINSYMVYKKYFNWEHWADDLRVKLEKCFGREI